MSHFILFKEIIAAFVLWIITNKPCVDEIKRLPELQQMSPLGFGKIIRLFFLHVVINSYGLNNSAKKRSNSSLDTHKAVLFTEFQLTIHSTFDVLIVL